MSTRQEIEIDYCPKCRGVWLDRGELDKLIERSLAELDVAPPIAANVPPRPAPRDDDRYRRDGDDRGYHEGRRPYDDDRRYDDDYHKRRRRKSMWGEIFDFD